MELKHRAAMAPLTRYRATDEHVPTPMMAEYYAQRASVPGTLLVTEATFISAAHGGYNNVPGIWNEAQVKGWRVVTDAVHAKGSFIVCQLWALGRTAKAEVAAAEGITIKSSSPVPLDKDRPVPVEMTVDDIHSSIQAYATAAKNAISAGFDAVELHAANGYLIDQFLQDKVNQRTDEWGGSVENRSRFAFEATKAVVQAIGPEKTGIRLSPFSTFQGMRMDDFVPQFTDILHKLNPLGLAYVHLTTSRVAGSFDIKETDTLDFAYDIWDGPLLIAGGINADTVDEIVEQRKDKDIVAVFGRYFISTPDLPFRLKEGIPFNNYDRSTFYTPKSAVGYTDQPFSKEFAGKVFENL
jgi:NADPH2 dehydrogenase